MSSAIVEVGDEVEVDYRSPLRVLVKWFRDSRDNWKQKFMALKAELKRLKVRVADMEKSRRQWRERAEQSEQQLNEMRSELEDLQQQVSVDLSADSDRMLEKKTRRRACLQPLIPPS